MYGVVAEVCGVVSTGEELGMTSDLHSLPPPKDTQRQTDRHAHTLRLMDPAGVISWVGG